MVKSSVAVDPWGVLRYLRQKCYAALQAFDKRALQVSCVSEPLSTPLLSKHHGLVGLSAQANAAWLSAWKFEINI